MNNQTVPPESATSPAESSGPSRSRSAVLIIDDDQALCRVLCKALSEAGYEAVGALDGTVGLKLYSQKKFDLVISDIVMPNCDGVELIMALRKMDPKVAIIVMSGGGRISAENYLRIAAAFGVSGVLRKPFTMPSLLEMVRREIPPLPRPSSH
jgi:DNA-binding NtrC family response regulator